LDALDQPRPRADGEPAKILNEAFDPAMVRFVALFHGAAAKESVQQAFPQRRLIGGIDCRLYLCSAAGGK